MRFKKLFLVSILIFSLLTMSCVYIVLPQGLDVGSTIEDKGWSGVVTNIGKSDAGDLRIDITIRNETGAWSSMKAVDSLPAVLSSGGKSSDCTTVFIGTGGHRLAPGFQIRGYTGGIKSEQVTQLLYVECPAGDAAPGAELTIKYAYFKGDLDYYHQEDGKIEGTMVLKLDEPSAQVQYPVYQAADGLVEAKDFNITAISDNVVSLVDIQRSDKGFTFTWKNANPTDFALKTHIGTPPVVCSDGVIYGWYEIMDLVSVPLTPAKGDMTWTTETSIPPEAKGCYILLSVESKNVRLYVNHLIDITDK